MTGWKKGTPGAKALISHALGGTAEAVPFVLIFVTGLF